jgi:hypothetical protein
MTYFTCASIDIDATMASPHSFHERAGPVSDTVDSLFPPPAPALHPFRLRPPPSTLSASGPPPFAYAFCSLAASLDSVVKMAS